MNDTLKWTLIGIGAYLLYQQYVAAPAVIAATPTTAAPPPAPPASTPLPPTSTTSASTVTSAQQTARQNLLTLLQQGQGAILAAAKVPATQLYTASQWNYYLPYIGVTVQPDLSNYGMDLTTAVPIATWFAAAVQYFTAAGNSPTGLGTVKAKKKEPLIPVTFDMNATSW